MANTFFSLFSKDANAIENLEHLKASLQLLPTSVCLLNEENRIVFANAHMEKIFAIKSGTLEGKAISSYGLTSQDIRSLAEEKGNLKLVKEMVTNELKNISVSVAVVPIPDTPYCLVQMEDAPEYRKVSTEKDFFRSILEACPLAITVQDPEGTCLAWNRQATKLFDVSASEAIDNKLTDVLPGELPNALALLDKELQQNSSVCLARQMNFKKKTGQEYFLSVSKVIVNVPSMLGCILTVYEDVSSRRAQEDQANQMKNLLEAILEYVPLGIYTRTVDGDMIYYNKQSQIILGQQNESFVNHPHAYQTTAEANAYYEREKALIEKGKIQEYPAESYVDEHGNKKLIRIIKVPLLKAGARPLVLTIVDDVTHKEEQERKIRTANTFLSAIVDNVPVGIYVRDREGKMLLSNKKSEEIFQDEMSMLDEQGNSPHETEEQRASYLKREQDILESGQLLEIPDETYMTCRGEKRILHMIKAPALKVDGKFNFVITMIEDITKRKQQERELDEINHFQQAILDNAPVAIYAYDIDQQVRFFNKMAKAMFPEDEDIDRHDAAYIAREQGIFKEGKVLDIPEEEWIDKDGNKRLLHLLKSPVFDKEGKPFVVLTIAEDITEKKQQEKEILRSKNFLQNIVDNLPVALSVKKPDGTYIVWNKRSENLFGVLAKDVLGKASYRTDIPKEQLEFVLESDQKVFANRRELNIAQELISTPNEGVKIMHTVKTPLYTAEGEPDYLLSVSEDITGKTKMEKQIREANEKNSLLVENTREGIVILEARKVIYANRAAYTMLGCQSVEELAGQSLADFVAPDYRQAASEKYETVINKLPGSEVPMQLYFKKKSGVTFEAEISALASTYLGRRIVIVFIQDITLMNKALRDTRSEREIFKQIFELGVQPTFVLNRKGYIQTMNKRARDLFHFTENDKNFYRNVYLRPALNLETRRQMYAGQPAHMDYVFDFDWAARKFPGRVRGEGKVALHLIFIPFNRRNMQNGEVQADYLVTVACEGDHAALPITSLDDAAAHDSTPQKQTVSKEAHAAAGTVLGEQTKNFIRTLAEVNLPAVILDLDLRVQYANPLFISNLAGQTADVKGKEFFENFISNAAENRNTFQTMANKVSGSAFHVQFQEHESALDKKYSAWDVFVLRNKQGKVDGYGLIRTSL